MKPYRQGDLFHFTYNLQPKTMEQEDHPAQTCGLKKIYENMPGSFLEEVVFPENREDYADIYNRIKNGERFATCDFRGNIEDIITTLRSFPGTVLQADGTCS